MAAGDVIVLANMRVQGLHFMAGTVQLDGANPTPIQLSAYMSSVLTGVVCLQGSTLNGADPNNVQCVVNGTSLDVYASKITAVGDATEIASTNATRLVHWFAIGVDAIRKGTS